MSPCTVLVAEDCPPQREGPVRVAARPALLPSRPRASTGIASCRHALSSRRSGTPPISRNVRTLEVPIDRDAVASRTAAAAVRGCESRLAREPLLAAVRDISGYVSIAPSDLLGRSSCAQH